MKHNSTKWLIGVLTVLFASILTVPAFAQGGWKGEQGGSIVRASHEVIVTPLDVATTGAGDITTYTLVGTEAAGDNLADDLSATVNSPLGFRTFAVRYDEADADGDDIYVKITGTNQFGGLAEATYQLDGDGIAYGTIAFAPYPEIDIEITYASNPEAGDVLAVYSYGFALWANPQDSGDVLSELFYDDSGDSYTENADGTFTAYNASYSTYVNTDLDKNDIVRFWFNTSSYRSTYVDSGGGRATGPRFIQTYTE